MTAGPIPFTAVIEYFRVYDIDGELDEFTSIIRRMDDVFLELTAKDVKKNSKKGNKSASTNANKKNSHPG